MYRKLNLRKGDIIQEEHLAHIEQGIADATPMVNVTYAELVALRNEGKLIAGQMYRMTDYETTCTWENTQVAGHPFDLVLTALDERTLDEKCSAIWSARDTDGYFANSNLPAWDVRYCLDNDTERFKWKNADEDYVTWVDANGKGVIYLLTDERANTCSFDFKNILHAYNDGYVYTFHHSEEGVDGSFFSDFNNNRIIDCADSFVVGWGGTHISLVGGNGVHIIAYGAHLNLTQVFASVLEECENVKIAYNCVNLNLTMVVGATIEDNCRNITLNDAGSLWITQSVQDWTAEYIYGGTFVTYDTMSGNIIVKKIADI